MSRSLLRLLVLRGCGRRSLRGRLLGGGLLGGSLRGRIAQRRGFSMNTQRLGGLVLGGSLRGRGRLSLRLVLQLDRVRHVGGAHDALLFDASLSSDADGEPLSYVWDLGDGITRTGEKVLHSYGEAGEYDVRLAVSDGTGLACGQSSAEMKVDVRRRE